MIHVYGIGPGALPWLSQGITVLFQEVDVIMGSERQLEVVPTIFKDKKRQLDRKLHDVREYLLAQENQQKDTLLLAPGDPMLFGIANFLIKEIGTEHLTVYSGISSLQYIFSRIGIAMNDSYLTSSHGKTPNYDLINQLSKIALVTDERVGPYQLAQELIKRGNREAIFYIGENLSYPEERIRSYLISDVPNENYDTNVVVILNEG